MAQLFTNNASSELAVSIGQTTTSITLKSNTGARFPAVVQGSGDYFFLTIYDQVGGAESNYEIVKVINRSNDIITVQRGQDGTTPMAYIAGAKVELRLTSEAVNTIDASEVKSKTDVIALQNVIAGNNLQGAHLLVSGDSHLGEATFDGTITANQLINATMGLSASQITTAALSTLHSLKVQTTAEFDGAAVFGSAFSLTGDQVQISEGGTGATTAAQARTNLDVFSKSEADERYINTTDAAMVTLTNSLAVTGVNGISTTILNVTGAVILSGDQIQVSEGGTGATTASQARINLGTVNDPTVNGFAVRTAANTLVGRSLTPSTGIAITNADGTAGNPSISNTGVLAITTGTGLSTNTNATGSVSITNIDRGSAQNIFKNITNSAGATQFSATTNTDSLSVAATGTSTVAFDSTNRRITISSADQFTGTVTNVKVAPNTGIAVTSTGTNANGEVTSSGSFTITNIGVTKNLAGAGISVAGTLGVAGTGDVTITNTDTGSAQFIFKSIADSAGTSQFSATTNTDSLRFAAGTGASVSFASATKQITYTNTGVTSAVAGTGVSVSSATGAVTIANTGVTSAVAGTGITVSGATGAVTVTNNDRGSTQNIFKNIANSAGTTQFSAATNTDTIQFAASGTTSVAFDSVNKRITFSSATPTPNNGTLSLATSGTGLSGSATFTADQAGNTTFTVASNATSANTASTLVARDAAGNFSAGTITAALSGNATTATSAGTATTATTANTLAVTDDTTTNATYYPSFALGTSGGQSHGVSSTKLTFNPSSGTLGATTFSGALNGNASTATTATTATNQSGGTVNATTGSFSGQVTSTVATGTAPFSVASTTAVNNLSIGGNAATATTATNQSGGTVSATTGSFSGQITSTVADGTAPFVVASTTTVDNLTAANSTRLNGINNSTTATANTIAQRDLGGVLFSNVFSGALNGNATSATSAASLTTARTIQGVSFNGTANITVVTAGTGISVSGTTVTNTGVTSVNGATGAVTFAPRSYLAGCTLSTVGASTTMSIAAGTAVDSTNQTPIDLANAINKTTAAWAAGTNSGGLDTGAIANSTWYYFFVIRNSASTAVDVIFSTSPTAPTLPSGFTQFRYIGAGFTNGTAQWTKFFQYGDEFRWDIPVQNFNGAGTTTATLLTLSVPRGRKMRVLVTAAGFSAGTGGNGVYLSDPDASDLAVTNTGLASSYNTADPGSENQTAQAVCITNTNGQVRRRHANTATMQITTFGWTDLRGKDL